MSTGASSARPLPFVLMLVANLGLTLYVLLQAWESIGSGMVGAIVGVLAILVICPLILVTVIPAVGSLRRIDEIPPAKYWSRVAAAGTVAAIPWVVIGGLFFLVSFV